MIVKKRPLFSSLYRWAHRQQENFTTEGLAVLLGLLMEECPDAAMELLVFLSGGVFPGTLDPNERVEISTQPWTKEHGISDLEIRTSDCLLILEAKLEAYTGKGQLEAYQNKAKKESLSRSNLTLLSKYPETKASIPNDVHVLRWYKLAEKLKEIYSNMSPNSPSQFLVGDYIAFLLEMGLAIPELKSALSEAVKDFVVSYGEQILDKGRYRSLSRVEKKYPELKPLIIILRQMEQSVADLGSISKPRFDTGKHQGGWLGYNINSMEYFYCIYLKEPEVICFEANKRKLLPDQWDKESGEVFETKHGIYWRNKLDLNEKTRDFFNRPTSTQLGILEEFVRTSYDLAKSFTEP